MLLFVSLLLVSILLAHLTGRWLTAHLDVEPGHIREVMPTLPVAPLQTGRADRRWKQSVRRVEDRLLARFEGGVTGVSAAEIAADLSEDRRVVAGALERLREEVDCRLRVTRSGGLLHDFEAADIETLRSQRSRTLPAKLLMMGVAAAANIGAIWPVLTVLVVAVTSLSALVTNNRWGMAMALAGVGAITVIFGVTLAVSLGMHVLLLPRQAGPTLGLMSHTESRPDRWSDLRGRAESKVPFAHVLYEWPLGIDSRRGRRWSLRGNRLGVWILVFLICMTLLSLIAVVAWGRGLWRAITERDSRLDRVSPALWVRTADAVDWLEKWVPTNDLVGRVSQALRRMYAHRRPVDGDMGPRTLARAKQNGGVVPAVEIALEEGLDLAEATEIGAELCNIVDGAIVVGDDGELGFAFPDAILAEIDETAGLRNPAEDAADDESWWREDDGEPEQYDHLWAEYLMFDDTDPTNVERRSSQPSDAVPVNVVGLAFGHLQALDRLVAGTWLMASTAGYLLLWGPPAALSGYLTSLEETFLAWLTVFPTLTTALLVMMAAGTTLLSGVAHYTANTSAVHGVRRDARRAAFHLVRRAVEHGRDHVELSTLTDRVIDAFDDAWPDIPRGVVYREIRGVLVDLEISYDLDATPSEAGQRVDVTPLRRRLERFRNEDVETVFGEQLEAGGERDDEVVFDTQFEHDHVTALA